MRRCPRGHRRSVDRGARRPAIEPRKWVHPGCRRCSVSGRQYEQARHRKRLDDPAWSQTLACAEALCTGTGRSLVRPGWHATPGPHREGDEPKPMMHGREKSDPVVVAGNPANKAASAVAESGEPRTGTEGNAGQQSTLRAQNRDRVSQALERVRHSARQRKSTRRRKCALPSITRGRSRVRESRSHGSVRGAPSNGRPYRDPACCLTKKCYPIDGCRR